MAEKSVTRKEYRIKQALTPRPGIEEEVNLLNEANAIFDRIIEGDFEDYRQVALGVAKGKIGAAAKNVHFRHQATTLIAKEAKIVEHKDEN